MANEPQDPKDLDETWNAFMEAKSAGFSDRTVDQIFDVSASTVRRATADDGKQTGEGQ